MPLGHDEGLGVKIEFVGVLQGFFLEAGYGLDHVMLVEEGIRVHLILVDAVLEVAKLGLKLTSEVFGSCQLFVEIFVFRGEFFPLVKNNFFLFLLSLPMERIRSRF